MVMDRPIPGHITGLYLFTVFNLVAMLNVALVAGEVLVVDTKLNKTVANYVDQEAGFGPSVPESGIEGRLVYVTPHNACIAVNGTPTIGPHMIKYPWIALVAREDCDFALKVLNAQKAMFALVIVHNIKGDNELIQMGGGKYGPMVEIPSVFVGYDDGMMLFQQYSYNNTNVLIRIDSNNSQLDFSLYLWPFAIVIGTCFCLMIVFMVAKWFRDLRSRQRSRLSKKHLKKIPVKKFKKGDYYDVCAICLDDYEEGEKLRVLPCSHAYHVKCIDPWLLKNKKTCPVCKRRVMPGQDADSDTDSDEDNGNTTSATESTPLLSEQTRGASSRRSTFDTSAGLPEVVRQEALQGQSSSSSQPPTQTDEDDESSSEEGAVGGVEHESIEVVVETDSQANQNLAYSSDDDFLVATEKGKEKPKKLSQVV